MDRLVKPRVINLKRLPEEAGRLLTEFCDVLDVDLDEKSPEGRARLLELLGDADGLLQSDARIDKELLDKAPRLKVVSNVSVGYNNFDTEAMRERGVTGTHTPYVLDDTVADLIFALILSAARRVPELDRLVKQGEWGREGSKAEDHFGIDVHHATIGIVGMGRIGERVAKRAALGFGMNVLYHNRSRKSHAEEAYGARCVSLDELLAKSDYVVLLAPLTPETRGLFGAEQFDTMKSTAIFVNASRGPLVNEAALVEALRGGRIRAAALDVYESEPVAADHPLLRLPNVVTLPHIGSATAKTRFDMAVTAANNLIGGLLGDRKIYVVPELRRDSKE